MNFYYFEYNVSKRIRSVEVDFGGIIKHMNEHHKENLYDLVKRFGGVSRVDSVLLDSVDFLGLDIIYDKKKLRIDFDEKANEGNIKDKIITLCLESRGQESGENEAIAKEIKEFIGGISSIVLATISHNGEVLCSYAPIFNTNGNFFIYISEVAPHFSNIKHNPNNVDIMFIEDESLTKSIFARRRLRYKAEARILERDDEFERVFNEIAANDDNIFYMLKNMRDFYIVELKFINGRFVKSFGGAYDIVNGKISLVREENPHKFSK